MSLSFQDLILNLEKFWSKEGCLLIQPYDLEKGAGTFNPATFFGVLGPKPLKVGYVEPSRRPADGRYGENPNRMAKFHQYQVILKPSPKNVQDLYLKSLKAIGIDVRKHDIRFVEDDWESPTLGASGIGWEVWLDGMEISQFTYFQQMAGIALDPISVELTYGLERLTMYNQKIDNVYDMKWNKDTTYGEVHWNWERQFSRYHFDESDHAQLRKDFETAEAEAERLIGLGLHLPGFDQVCKTSHAFNLLDARGVISVTERARLIGRVRRLAKLAAAAHLEHLAAADAAKTEAAAV